MEQKRNTKEIPYGAQQLYIKLYCERKGKRNKKTVKEAKQSWFSLNVLEKKRFQKTTKQSTFLKYASRLSNTELYVKEKLHGRLNEPQAVGNEIILQDSEVSLNESCASENRQQASSGDITAVDQIDDKNLTKTELDDSHEPHILSQPGNESNIDVIETQSNPNNDEEANVGSSIASNQDNETPLDVQDRHGDSNSNLGSVSMPLTEPAPPTVKRGKELYDLIKQSNNKDWKDMTIKERNYYNSAVRMLKRDYIRNYTIYLESLTQKQLFDHYVKTIKT